MRHLLIVMAMVVGASCGHGDAEHKVTPLVEVKLAEAKTVDLTETIQAPGTVFPLAQAAVAAKVQAPIRELLVTKGSEVKKGQLIAVLENRDLEAARREAAGALQEAESALSRLASGALPGDVERAEAQVNITKSALETAQKMYDRRKVLVEEGAIPAKELLMSQNELATAQGNYLVAKKNLELLNSQTRERDLEMARSRVEQAKAKVAQAEAQLAYTRIRSPMDGVVSEQWMYPGDMAKPDAPIVTLVDIHKVIVRAQVPEAQAAALRLGQTAEFLAQDLSGRKFVGRISVISPVVDRAARTVEVWTEIDNGKKELRPGGYGMLVIASGKVKGAVVIPRAAAVLEEGANEGVVYTVDEKNIAHKRTVKVGSEHEGLLQVTEGLKAGEKVVAEGNYGLPDKAEVKAR